MSEDDQGYLDSLLSELKGRKAGTKVATTQMQNVMRTHAN